jgi:hypothetical protein
MLMKSPCCSCVLPFPATELFSDIQETWYERHTVRGHLNLVLITN